MDMRGFREFMTRRSSIWTIGLCMTGVIVLGGIAAMDGARRAEEEPQTEESVYVEKDVNDTLDEIPEEEAESEAAAEVSGTLIPQDAQQDDQSAASGEETVSGGENQQETVSEAEPPTQADDAETASVPAEDTQAAAVQEASSSGVITQDTLLENGIDFSSDQDLLLWPAAGPILIDYSMDKSVYFETLNQYKYNPALIIGSNVGNQVLAAARGLVESIYIDEETGTTLVMNIGGGYHLTYGQLKELAVEEGDLVEEGSVLGYVSEPTKYYGREGSNLYFAMTGAEGEAVDPVLYLE